MSHAARRNFIAVSLICITLIITAIYWYVPQLAADADVSPGNLWSWGGNGVGQLGTGTGTTSTAIAPPEGAIDVNNPGGFLTDIINISSTGEHSLALKADHTVWAMGTNGAGQLGTALGTTPPDNDQRNFR